MAVRRARVARLPQLAMEGKRSALPRPALGMVMRRAPRVTLMGVPLWRGLGARLHGDVLPRRHLHRSPNTGRGVGGGPTRRSRRAVHAPRVPAPSHRVRPAGRVGHVGDDSPRLPADHPDVSHRARRRRHLHRDRGADDPRHRLRGRAHRPLPVPRHGRWRSDGLGASVIYNSLCPSTATWGLAEVFRACAP